MSSSKLLLNVGSVVVFFAAAVTLFVISNNRERAQDLITAVERGDIKVAKTLIEQGANPNAATDSGVPALLLSIAKKELEIEKLLIEKGADVNVAFNGVTPLIAAARTGQPGIVELLLEQGVGVDPVFVDSSVIIAGTYVDMQRIIVFIAGVMLVVLLWLFTHHTPLGLAFRGIAQDESTTQDHVCPIKTFHQQPTNLCKECHPTRGRHSHF